MQLTALEILKKFWGYDQFRYPQDEIVAAHLEGKDVLALLPTGAGKSICYQVPALMQEGLCMVVSPLIALMKDQVQQLRKRNIGAGAIFSGMKEGEINGVLNNCATGHFKFLYVSPERLGSDRFLTALRGLHVSMLAVDEAHCISQWGFDFRPSYRDIVLVREMFPEMPVMALTASATPEVQKDIVKSLQFKEGFAQFMSSFERPNISFAVRSNVSKPDKILEILEKIPGSAIIYSRNRRKTEDISKFLERNKISSTFYHAGLENQERNRRQEAWIAGKYRVMSCTNAFGMGIDKPDVRLVIHADLPDSLEAYYQEAGRAGRDGKISYAVLLCNQEDKDNLLEQEQQRFPDFELVKKIYNSLYNYLGIAFGGGKRHSFEFDIHHFARRYKWDTLLVFNALKLLEQSGYLHLSEAFYLPSRVNILLTGADLYKFQVQHKEYDEFIKTILRNYEGVVGHYIRINEIHLAKKAGMEEKDVQRMLKMLHRLKVLSYIPSSDSPRITFMEERLPDDLLRLDHAFIAFSRKQMRQRIDAMMDYAEAAPEACRQVIIREYFGEKNTEACGKCDLCLNRRYFKNLTSDAIRKIILKKVEESPGRQMAVKDLLQTVGHTSKEQYLEVIRILLDEGTVKWINEQQKVISIKG
jgi:ATP-dependent DNA helicase RecQ